MISSQSPHLISPPPLHPAWTLLRTLQPVCLIWGAPEWQSSRSVAFRKKLDLALHQLTAKLTVLLSLKRLRDIVGSWGSHPSPPHPYVLAPGFVFSEWGGDRPEEKGNIPVSCRKIQPPRPLHTHHQALPKSWERSGAGWCRR